MLLVYGLTFLSLLTGVGPIFITLVSKWHDARVIAATKELVGNLGARSLAKGKL